MVIIGEAEKAAAVGEYRYGNGTVLRIIYKSRFSVLHTRRFFTSLGNTRDEPVRASASARNTFPRLDTLGWPFGPLAKIVIYVRSAVAFQLQRETLGSAGLGPARAPMLVHFGGCETAGAPM